MKRKILISTLTLLFLVSTTGLPVTISLCKMAEDEETDQCVMHHKPVESSCCAEETFEYQITLSDYSGCCEVKFVYNKVDDEFIYNKTEISFSSSEYILQPIALSPTVHFYYNESFYCDSSPPFLINPELHITNSILLI
jgi:hypothetical protein